MQPAFSVIFFTVSTGTGYGLLFLLGLLGAAGKLPADHTFGFIGMALGLALVGAGLLSSMLHLGHPERAWRALSQWKTSWLSREGVASVISFVPGLAMMYLWVFESTSHPMFALFGLATALMAFVTVYCTAMIYRSLPPIHQWANGWTLPNYLFMGLAGGGVVLVGLYGVVGAPLTLAPICAVGALFVAWGVKSGYWRFIDNSKSQSTAETATGLGHIGKVTQMESPHTEDNYLLKEMGFQIGRKHGDKLRRYANVLTFLLPILLLGATQQTTGYVSSGLSLLAVLSFALGAITERWLFFAQAEHTVTLYYGR
jgi:DMSO reductase anchor subunit